MLLGVCNQLFNNKAKISLWSRSFKRFSPDAVVLLAINATERDLQSVADLPLKVISVNLPHEQSINHTRLKVAADYLDTITDEHILYTDVFDVVFQDNPLLLDFSTYDIFVSGEGVTVNQEPWNADNISKLFPGDRAVCSDQEVINSGVIAGNRAPLSSLLKRMYAMCEGSTNKHDIQDQAALIVMVAKKQVDKLKIYNLNDSWAMHCAVAGPTQFFNVWGFFNIIKEKYCVPELYNGRIVNKQRSPYAIVHQFNRIPTWYKILRTSYD